MMSVLKVILLGKCGVGKTSLMNQYAHQKFISHYKATIGTDFVTKKLYLNSKPVTLQIWDTAGQERYQSLGSAFYRGADCCVLVYDVTKRDTFNGLETLRSDFITQTNLDEPNKFPFLLIGNKTDLQNERKVSYDEALEWCQEKNFIYYETSVKLGTNVSEAFESLALIGIEYQETDKISNEGETEQFNEKRVDLIENKKELETSCYC